MSPKSGNREGGEVIAVMGSGFAPGLVCKFGEIQTVPAIYLSPEEIQCKTPKYRGNVTEEEEAQVPILIVKEDQANKVSAKGAKLFYTYKKVFFFY